MRGCPWRSRPERMTGVESTPTRLIYTITRGRDLFSESRGDCYRELISRLWGLAGSLSTPASSVNCRARLAPKCSGENCLAPLTSGE